MLKYLNKLVKKKNSLLTLRIGMLLATSFLLAVLILKTVTIKQITLTNTLVMTFLWTFWWPFLYISILLMSRSWCGFLCPMGLLNEIGNKRKPKKIFKWARFTALPFILFFIFVYFEQVSGLFISTKLTLIFMSSFLLFALLFGLTYRRWSFCKNICPVGTLLGVFSRLSLMGLRTNAQICATCKGKYCLTGNITAPCPMFNNVPNLDSSKDCLMCAKCIQNCPKKSAEFTWLTPGREILKRAGFNISEAFFIIGLIGMVLILTTEGTRFVRTISTTMLPNMNASILRLTDFLLGIGISIAIFVIISQISNRITKNGLKETVKNNAYAYLPFAFSLLFTTIIFGFLYPYLKITETIIVITKYAILFFGFIWSVYYCYKIIGQNKKTAVLNICYLAAIFLVFIIYILPGPLKIIEGSSGSYVLQEGQVLSMDSYSMGFKPNNIVVKKDQEIRINITNDDIIHSFDMDEFGIHEILKSNEQKQIVFYPTKKGSFEFYCKIPGHTEAGMKGVLNVV